MNEIVFRLGQESDGGLTARCLMEGISTQAENWEELRRNLIEALSNYYFDPPQPHPYAA